MRSPRPHPTPRRGAVALVAAALVAIAAGCSDGELADGTVDPMVVTTTTVAPAASPDAPPAPEEPAAPVASVPTTAAPAPVRALPAVSLRPAGSGLPEELSRNSRREPIALDETALLACAKNQIAFVELQRSDPEAAARELAAAAQRAAASAVPEVREAAASLETAATAADPSATVLAFLGTCTARGFEY